MKKIIALLTSLVLVMLVTACASTPVAIGDCGPIAILAVTGNPALPWEADDSGDDSADDGNGVLTTMVNKLVDGANPELTTGKDRLDYAVDSLRACLQEIAGVEVVEPSRLLEAEQYKAIAESVFNMLDSKIAASGYKTMTSLGAKRSRLLMEEIGAKSLILLDFDFRKTCTQGNKWNGDIAPMLTMKVHLINERGKEVLTRSFVMKSPESVRASGRKYDKSQLVGLYPALIDNAIRQFVVSYVQ